MTAERATSPDPQTTTSEAPREKCGVFGVYGRDEDVGRIAFFGLFALQHRGQESAGIAVSNGERVWGHKAMGLVTQVFDEDILGSLSPAHIAVGHTRYSTCGSSVPHNAQPIICASASGDLALAHNGNLVNMRDLQAQLAGETDDTNATNDSALIARMLGRSKHRRIEDALAEVMPHLQGAYSLVLMTPTQLAAVRDPYGIRPLSIGHLGEGRYVFASESCAISVVGGHFHREVEPGEVVVVDDDGLRETQIMPVASRATCVFEFIYFARPDTQIYSRTIYDARRRMGHELAREHPAPGAHIVIPIPDSAVAAALGYAEASRIPFGEGLVKNRYIQRTFIQPVQRMRDLGARMKFSPLREAIAGHKVVMVDDSIVRGTTTGKIVRMLREAGATEVHVRITSPPVRYPCYYGIDMADQKDLVAARKTVDGIRDHIGATSLGYLSLGGVMRAIGLPKKLFCRACFDGQYPIPIPTDVRLSKMMLEEPNVAAASRCDVAAASRSDVAAASRCDVAAASRCDGES
ncbi:MAG: amidophosphoribosyltransferase [Armatimonadetes bacterium]|nr:amidophosphoribosyltransferase [Armatimonadota bacterium]